MCGGRGGGRGLRRVPSLALASWGGADLVLVGVDLADEVVRVAPPRRPGVHVVGLSPDDAVFRAAVALGAASVVDLPDGSPWLADALADVGERASPGRIVGVVGGAGGAGATTLACALAQWHAARGPTLLVDADPLGPGVDRLLGMEDRAGVRWEGLVETSGRLGARALREGVPRAGGLGVLTWGGARRRLDVATARRILAAAVRGHDLVVIDLARQGDAGLAELVDRCDDLLVVTPATVPGLAATARLVADLGRCGPRRARRAAGRARRRRRSRGDRAAGGRRRRRAARAGRLGRPGARPADRAGSAGPGRP